MEPIDVEYNTYNAMNRQAVVFGIPLIPAAVSFAATAPLTSLAMVVVGARAYYLLIAPIVFCMWLKSISVNDDQRYRIVFLETLIRLRMGNSALFDGTFTLLHSRHRRHAADYSYMLESELLNREIDLGELPVKKIKNRKAE